MNYKIFISFVIVACSGLFFTEADAQCAANFFAQQQTDGSCGVVFNDLSTGTNSGTAYFWDFGDGQSSTIQGPTNTYSASGTYSVCLSILVNFGSTNACSNSFCQTVTTVACGVGEVASSEQIRISLDVNNPIFSSADIHYSISSAGSTELVLSDVLGNKIGVLDKGNKSAGSHSCKLNTNNYSQGIYFINLSFEGKTITKKIIIAN